MKQPVSQPGNRYLRLHWASVLDDSASPPGLNSWEDGADSDAECCHGELRAVERGLPKQVG